MLKDANRLVLRQRVSTVEHNALLNWGPPGSKMGALYGVVAWWLVDKPIRCVPMVPERGPTAPMLRDRQEALWGSLAHHANKSTSKPGRFQASILFIVCGKQLE